jgi:hypothetical protein
MYKSPIRDYISTHLGFSCVIVSCGKLSITQTKMHIFTLFHQNSDIIYFSNKTSRNQVSSKNTWIEAMRKVISTMKQQATSDTEALRLQQSTLFEIQRCTWEKNVVRHEYHNLQQPFWRLYWMLIIKIQSAVNGCSFIATQPITYMTIFFTEKVLFGTLGR